MRGTWQTRPHEVSWPQGPATRFVAMVRRAKRLLTEEDPPKRGYSGAGGVFDKTLFGGETIMDDAVRSALVGDVDDLGIHYEEYTRADQWAQLIDNAINLARSVKELLRSKEHERDWGEAFDHDVRDVRGTGWPYQAVYGVVQQRSRPFRVVNPGEVDDGGVRHGYVGHQNRTVEEALSGFRRTPKTDVVTDGPDDRPVDEIEEIHPLRDEDAALDEAFEELDDRDEEPTP